MSTEVSFPDSFEHFSTLVRNTESRAIVLDQEAVTLARRARAYAAQSRRLSRLLISWKDSRIGKRDEGIFFLDVDGKRGVVRELLPPGTKFYSVEEWNVYREENKGKDFSFFGYDGVPPDYPIIPFSRLKCAECPLCGKYHPVLESYSQTEDGPEGDTWRKAFFLECLEKVSDHIISQTFWNI